MFGRIEDYSSASLMFFLGKMLFKRIFLFLFAWYVWAICAWAFGIWPSLRALIGNKYAYVFVFSYGKS